MVQIRNAVLDDIDALVDLWQRFGGPTRSTSRRAQARALVVRDPAALLVAEATDAKLVGSLIVGWDGWRCHMYRLVVEPGRRRAGIAEMLVAEARRRAKALGAERIDAMVHRDNIVAVAFWEAIGFELQDDDGRWSLAI